MDVFKFLLFIILEFLTYTTVYPQDWQIPPHAACEHFNLTIICPENQKIKVTYANYGRRVPSSVFCSQYDIPNENTDCVSANSMPIVQGLCDGKRTCSVAATYAVFGDPCWGTHKYLEVEYDCIEGGTF